MLGPVGTVFRDATIIDFHPPRVRRGTVRVEGAIITHVVEGNSATARIEAEITDSAVECAGLVLMPGLVNAHTHLYTSLAVGLPQPLEPPKSFLEYLGMIPWRLDRALDDESVFLSALAGATRAALAGTSCVIDQHSSPEAITGSLDLVKDALVAVGLRGVLSYQVSDRNGKHESARALEETARFVSQHKGNRMYTGVVGVDGAFAAQHETMLRVADVADEYNTRISMTCAESGIDAEDVQFRTGHGLAQYLAETRILRYGTILNHCNHLSVADIEEVRKHGCYLVTCPRAAMHDAQGYPHLREMDMGTLCIGTNGLGADIIAESQAGVLRARDSRTGVSMLSALRWVQTNADLAAQCLQTESGRIDAGMQADMVLLNYEPQTPLTSENLAQHWLYGMSGAHTDSLMVAGRWVVRGGELASERARTMLQAVPTAALRLWERVADL